MDAKIREQLNMILNNLNSDELDEAIKILSAKKISSDVIDIFTQALQAKYSEGYTCPYCGSKHFVKNGKHNNVQQYRCKECKKTFNWKKRLC